MDSEKKKNYCYPKVVYTTGLKLSFNDKNKMRNLLPNLSLVNPKTCKKNELGGKANLYKKNKIVVDLPQLMVIKYFVERGNLEL